MYGGGCEVQNDFDARVNEAVADLERIGRHWLPDPGSHEIHSAVVAKLSGRNIVHLEPHPWDEHVLCDATDRPPSDMGLSSIARRRMFLREQGLKIGLPE